MGRKSVPSDQTCLDAAYRYLAYRPRSEFEIRAWLQRKGFSGKAIREALTILKAKGLVDDLAFARFWRESRETASPRSRAALRRELCRKGIDPEVVSEALDGVDEEAAAYRAAQRKAARLRNVDHDDFVAKLSGVLRRRGFSYEVTEHTVNRLWQESVRNA
ncbi:MAG: regulatory protein RecX [Dehalococcoidia bacterium]|nr:regulatory protein RecX [Dehalococcoidia bacterium]